VKISEAPSHDTANTPSSCPACNFLGEGKSGGKPRSREWGKARGDRESMLNAFNSYLIQSWDEELPRFDTTPAAPYHGKPTDPGILFPLASSCLVRAHREVSCWVFASSIAELFHTTFITCSAHCRLRLPWLVISKRRLRSSARLSKSQWEDHCHASIEPYTQCPATSNTP